MLNLKGKNLLQTLLLLIEMVEFLHAFFLQGEKNIFSYLGGWISCIYVCAPKYKENSYSCFLFWLKLLVFLPILFHTKLLSWNFISFLRIVIKCSKYYFSCLESIICNFLFSLQLHYAPTIVQSSADGLVSFICLLCFLPLYSWFVFTLLGPCS